MAGVGLFTENDGSASGSAAVLDGAIVAFLELNVTAHSDTWVANLNNAQTGCPCNHTWVKGTNYYPTGTYSVNKREGGGEREKENVRARASVCVRECVCVWTLMGVAPPLPLP